MATKPLPIATTMFNLYLMPLDKELAAIPGAFYARYSDDVLLAHPDPDVVRRADQRLQAILSRLGRGEYTSSTS